MKFHHALAAAAVLFLSSTAKAERIAGTVRNEQGVPIQDVKCHIAGKRANTDSAGRFVLEDTRAGESSAYFSHPDYVRTSQTLTIPGPDVEVLMKSEGGVIKGQVLRDDDTPVIGAQVSVFMYEPASSYYSTSNHVNDLPLQGHAMFQRIETDNEGRFTYDKLPPGLYLPIAQEKGRNLYSIRLMTHLPQHCQAFLVTDKESTSGLILRRVEVKR